MESVCSTTNDIERVVKAHVERSTASRIFHAKFDKEKIQGWKQEIHKILGVFNVRRSYNLPSPLLLKTHRLL